MIISPKRIKEVDFTFISVLLALAATYLIVLRGNTFTFSAAGVALFYTLFFLLLGSWMLVISHYSKNLPFTPADGCDASPERKHWLRLTFASFALLSVVLANFYVPLKIHFWGGYDDFVAIGSSPAWNTEYDANLNRPLVLLGHLLPKVLRPFRIEGFLYYAAGLCFLNGLLLMGILRRLGSFSPAVCASAAVLFVANRWDPGRFFPLWAGNAYGTGLFFLLASFWLLLLSYHRGSRLLLAASCSSLVVSLLMHEAGYPIALLGPILLWLQKDRQRVPIWLYAWLGAIAVPAVRLVVFLVTKQAIAYQANFSAGLKSPAAMLKNLTDHFGAPLGYFKHLNISSIVDWPWGVLTVVVAGVFLWLSSGKVNQAGKETSRRSLVFGIGIAAVALVLTVIPFLPVPGLFRTHFYASPADATIVAFGLGLIGSFLSPAITRRFLFGVTSLLVAHSTVASLRSQNEKAVTSAITFAKTVHIFEQVRSLAPNLPPEALILFVLEDSTTTPLGCNYGCRDLSREVLGVSAIQANFQPGMDFSAVLGKDGVTVMDGTVVPPVKTEESTPFSKVLAVRLFKDGTVMLLDQIPEALLPEPGIAANYRPLDLMKPGIVTPLPYLRYTNRMEKLHDVLDLSPGMMLGRRWSPLLSERGDFFRVAIDGAQIAVNPMGKSTRTILLDVKPLGSDAASWELQAVDDRDQVVASAMLSKRQDVRLEVPVDSEKINLFRLRMHAKGPRAGTETAPLPFNVYCSGIRTRSEGLRPGASDIAAGGISLDQNWYPLESYAGETFRWVNNDAKIKVRRSGSERAVLVMRIEPGPGLGGDPCHVQLYGENGALLSEATATERTTLSFALPSHAVTAGAVIRIHVNGGGRPVDSDPRILNFRVFYCMLAE